jgi:hypothetical protein
MRRVAAAQAAYFVATGAAPFASRRAFEAVTGRKRDWWLVEAVGGLVTAVGAALAAAAARDRVTAELAVVGAGSAGTLAAVDVVHVASGRIRPVYLADAAVEAALLAGWAAAGVAARRGAGSERRA